MIADLELSERSANLKKVSERSDSRFKIQPLTKTRGGLRP